MRVNNKRGDIIIDKALLYEFLWFVFMLLMLSPFFLIFTGIFMIAFSDDQEGVSALIDMMFFWR